eukprot:c28470_g3_i2 orf=576-1334(+)
MSSRVRRKGPEMQIFKEKILQSTETITPSLQGVVSWLEHLHTTMGEQQIQMGNLEIMLKDAASLNSKLENQLKQLQGELHRKDAELQKQIQQRESLEDELKILHQEMEVIKQKSTDSSANNMVQELVEKVQEDLSQFKKETSSWADKVKKGLPTGGGDSNNTPHFKEIFTEMQERTRRALGVAVKGLKEVEGEDPLKVASQFFENNLKYTPPSGLSGAYRVGRVIEGRDRILIIRLKEAQDREKALRKRALL